MEVPFIGQQGEQRGWEVGGQRWGLTPTVFNIEAKGGELMGRSVDTHHSRPASSVGHSALPTVVPS
jgi:hypothetical protein